MTNSMVMMSGYENYNIPPNNVSTGLGKKIQLANSTLAANLNFSMESDNTSIDEEFYMPISQ